MKTTLLRRFITSAWPLAFLFTPALAARADYAAEVLAQHPLTYWRFNDAGVFIVPDNVATNQGSASTAANGAYTAQEAMKGATGVLAGDAGANCNGVAGQFIQVPWSATLNPAGAFSAEGWFKPAATGDNLCCFSSGHMADPRAGWLIYQQTGGWNFRTYNQNSTTPAVNITAGGAPVAGKWYHLVVTWDGSVGQLYVNGTPTAGAATTFVANPDGPTTIGTRSDNSFGWQGTVDEVAIYPQVLSASEVAADYSAATTNASGYASQVLAKNPVLYLRLDDTPVSNPSAANLGSLGAGAKGLYRGGLMPGSSSLVAPAYPGLETTNLSLTFDGTDDIIDIGAADVPTPWSAVFWVNRQDAPGASAALLNSSVAGLKLEQYEGAVNVNRFVGFTAYGVADYVFNYSAPTNTWVQLAYVGTSDGTVLYTNGFLADSNSGTIPLPLTRLGNLVDLPKGTLDEMATFGTALLEGQIRTLYLTAIGDQNQPGFVDNTPIVTPAGTIYATTTFTLSINVYGAGPLTYQWRKDGTVVGTSADYTKVNASVADNGTYDVIITNAHGSVTSGTVTITVNPAAPVTIDQQPAPRFVYPGGTASFTIGVSGTPPLTFQWKKNGADLAGQTNQTLSITNASSADAAAYSVGVTNVTGGMLSSSAALTLRTPAAGTYEAAIVSSGPAAYWRLGESSGTTAFDYLGGHDGTYTNVTLGLPGYSPNDSDTAAGFDRGQLSVIGVSAFPEFAYTGSSPTFSLETWAQFNDFTAIQRLFSKGGPGFAGIGFGVRDSGALRFTTYGVQDFDLSLPTALQTATWYHIVGVASGGTFNFYVNGTQAGSVAFTGAAAAANGNPPFAIGRNGLGADETVTGVMDETAVYTRALTADEILNHYSTGRFGTTTAPFIAREPASQGVAVGGSSTLSVSAQGSVPLAYQWKKGGAPVTGATGSALTLTNLAYTDAGVYSVTITNSVGSTNSADATLSVLPAPTFANLTNNLVLHLKFNGDFTDSSGRGNDAFASGTPALVPGKLGQAVQLQTAVPTSTFNFLSLSDINRDLVFAATDDFTISLWIKYTTGFNDLPILANAVNSTYQKGLVLSEDGGKFEWTAVGVDTGSIIADPVGGPLINDGTWHQVAVAFNHAAGEADSYVDGVLVNTTSIVGLGTLDTGNTLTIGQDPTGVYGVSGTFGLDDLGIWRRALNAYEVLSLYNAAQAGQSFDVLGPVKVSITTAGNNLVIAWQAGTLESNDDVTNPNGWSAVPGAIAPTQIITPGSGKKFYRVRL